jgi:hypothetical protein
MNLSLLLRQISRLHDAQATMANHYLVSKYGWSPTNDLGTADSLHTPLLMFGLGMALLQHFGLIYESLSRIPPLLSNSLLCAPTPAGKPPPWLGFWLRVILV